MKVNELIINNKCKTLFLGFVMSVFQIYLIMNMDKISYQEQYFAKSHFLQIASDKIQNDFNLGLDGDFNNVEIMWGI